MSKHKLTLKYLLKNISVVFGVVLIWRGLWYALDAFDKWLLGGNHIWTAVIGVVLGLVILYLPDHDLKEIGNL